MVILSHTLMLLAVVLWTTLLWYPWVMHVLYRRGIGLKTRHGKPRPATVIEWLNATGCGIFFGNIVFVLARLRVK